MTNEATHVREFSLCAACVADPSVVEKLRGGLAQSFRVDAHATSLVVVVGGSVGVPEHAALERTNGGARRRAGERRRRERRRLPVRDDPGVPPCEQDVHLHPKQRRRDFFDELAAVRLYRVILLLFASLRDHGAHPHRAHTLLLALALPRPRRS